MPRALIQFLRGISAKTLRIYPLNKNRYTRNDLHSFSICSGNFITLVYLLCEFLETYQFLHNYLYSECVRMSFENVPFVSAGNFLDFEIIYYHLSTKLCFNTKTQTHNAAILLHTAINSCFFFSI